jgi:hypothetical protein
MAELHKYRAEHPEVDWTENEIFWVFTDTPGVLKVGGHRPIDNEKNKWIKETMKKCCCHPNGCP